MVKLQFLASSVHVDSDILTNSLNSTRLLNASGLRMGGDLTGKVF